MEVNFPSSVTDVLFAHGCLLRHLACSIEDCSRSPSADQKVSLAVENGQLSRLLCLPDELNQHILGHLDAKSILVCGAVCRQLYVCTADPLLLKKVARAHAALGMEPALLDFDRPPVALKRVAIFLQNHEMLYRDGMQCVHALLDLFAGPGQAADPELKKIATRLNSVFKSLHLISPWHPRKGPTVVLYAFPSPASPFLLCRPCSLDFGRSKHS